MKTKVFLCIFLTLNLHALSLNQIQNAFKEKQYQKSFSLAQKYLKTKPTSIQANMLLASSAYKLKRFAEAYGAYERVLILEPNNIEANLAQAQLYYEKKNYKLLDLSLQNIKSSKLNKKQAKHYAFLKQKLQKIQEKRYSLQASLGLLYDTNINSDMGDKSFDVYLGSAKTELRGDKEQNGLAHFENLYLSAFSQTHNNFFLTGSLNAYNKDYFDGKYSQDDLSFLGLKLSPTYKLDNIYLSLPLEYEMIFLDKKSYAKSFKLSFDGYKMYHWGLINARLLFNDTSYDKEKNKDFNKYSLKLYTKKINKLYVFGAGLELQKAKAKKDKRVDVSYSGLCFVFDGMYKLKKNIFLKADLSVDTKRFDDKNKLFKNKRKDGSVKLGLGGDYIFSAHSLSLKASYLKQNSNQDIYAYDKLNASVYYTYRF